MRLNSRLEVCLIVSFGVKKVGACHVHAQPFNAANAQPMFMGSMGLMTVVVDVADEPGDHTY